METRHTVTFPEELIRNAFWNVVDRAPRGRTRADKPSVHVWSGRAWVLSMLGVGGVASIIILRLWYAYAVAATVSVTRGVEC